MNSDVGDSHLLELWMIPLPRTQSTKAPKQDYDTVFDNSILYRKNDPLRILECSVPGLPGLPTLEVCVCSFMINQTPADGGDHCHGPRERGLGSRVCGQSLRPGLAPNHFW